MIGSLNTAVSGLQQFQQAIDVIGNNIANVNTTGYKDARTDFADSFSMALGSSPGNQIGTGVTTTLVQSNFNQGTLNATQNETDLAVKGQGFFVVRNPSDSSSYFTRDGQFFVDGNGYLTYGSGLRVQGYNDSALTTVGDLKVDATGAPATATPGATMKSYSIDNKGNINVVLSDGTQFVRGQVLLQNCRNPGALIKEGNNLYTLTAAAGGLAAPTAAQTNGLGLIQDHTLEASNVDLTSEMANLITVQRAFQANAKIITTSDEVLQDIVNLKR